MPPVLVVPLPQIEQELDQQIDLGREILRQAPFDLRPDWHPSRRERMQLEHDLYNRVFAYAQGEVLDWERYNVEFLRRCFSTNEIADQYNSIRTISGGGDPYRMSDALRRDIQTQLQKLESLRTRVHEYAPAPPAAPTPTAAAIHIQGSVYGSPIQASSPGAHQTVAVGMSLASVHDFLKQLEQSAPALNLPVHESQELTAEIATIKAQLQSPKPKNQIIRESLSSVRTILEGAGGSMVATGLLDTLQHIHL
jgi:hypothetical protein